MVFLRRRLFLASLPQSLFGYKAVVKVSRAKWFCGALFSTSSNKTLNTDGEERDILQKAFDSLTLVAVVEITQHEKGTATRRCAHKRRRPTEKTFRRRTKKRGIVWSRLSRVEETTTTAKKTVSFSSEDGICGTYVKEYKSYIIARCTRSSLQ